MKQIFATALAALMWGAAFAQKNSDKLYHTIADEDGVLAFTLNKEKLAAIDTDFNLNGTASHVTGDFQKARIVITTNPNPKVNSPILVSELKKLGFNEVDLEDDSNTVKLFTNAKGKKFTEVHLISTTQDGSCVWLCISGDMYINKQQ